MNNVVSGKTPESGVVTSELMINNYRDVPIPGVFSYKVKEGVFQDLYKSANDAFYDVYGNVVDKIDFSKLEHKTERITMLDIFSLGGLSDEEIIEIISNELKADINTQVGIEYLNEIFNDGIKFLGNFRTVAPEFKDIIFRNKKQIIDFFKENEEESFISFMKNLVSKMCYISADVLNNKKNCPLCENSSEIKKQYFTKDRGFTWSDDNTGVLNIDGKNINFFMAYNYKSDESRRLKVAKDPKYDSSSKIEDEVQITFYSANKEDALIILSHISGILYDDFRLKDKLFFSTDVIKSVKGKISGVLLDKIKERETFKKRGSSNEYSEGKVTGTVPIGDSGYFGTEVKVDLFDSRNEHGLGFHSIYHYYKYLEAKCRLEKGYISDGEITQIVNELFDKLRGKLQQKNNNLPLQLRQKSLLAYHKELGDALSKCKDISIKQNKFGLYDIGALKKGLIDYYKSKLLEVNIDSSSNTYFTTSREYNLSIAGFNEKMSIAANEPEMRLVA